MGCIDSGPRNQEFLTNNQSTGEYSLLLIIGSESLAGLRNSGVSVAFQQIDELVIPHILPLHERGHIPCCLALWKQSNQYIKIGAWSMHNERGHKKSNHLTQFCGYSRMPEAKTSLRCVCCCPSYLAWFVLSVCFID